MRILRSLVLALAIAASSVESAGNTPAGAEDLVIVDCLLPGQIRRLGQRATYLTARRPVRTTAFDCRVRGGEYVAHDRANLGTALRVWLESARRGDVEAMITVAELFERGTGANADYTAAARWYERAAEKGSSRARIALGNLYEQGLGVPRNPARAAMLYRQAAGLPGSIAMATLPAGDGAGVPVSGPVITLIEPPLGTRGLVRTELAHKATMAEIIGRVDAPAGLLSLKVGGRNWRTNPAGVFRVPLDKVESERRIHISAVDQLGTRADLSLALVPPGSAATTQSKRLAGPSREEFGNYHALLIANFDYARMPDLSSPAADVARIGDVLETRYGFSVRTLVNATRFEILSALNEARARLTSEDNLLVYYAGHGELDRVNSRGHWLPVDADPDNTANWISNVTITDILNVTAARQVLLVADSCYAGTLTRSSIAQLDTGMTEAERDTWLRVVSKKRARLVLTSGGVAPVLDMGGGEHSVFARALIDALSENRDILTGRALYQAVTARVTHAAAHVEFEQVPEFAPISRAGHEAGDFFLIPDSP